LPSSRRRLACVAAGFGNLSRKHGVDANGYWNTELVSATSFDARIGTPWMSTSLTRR
jgi:hypothetical protein